MNNELLDYCRTDRQREIISAVLEAGSQKAAANLLNIDPSSVSQAMTTVRRRAASQGHAPEHDYTHPVPEGFKAKGVSTLYDADGKVSVQWVGIEARERGFYRIPTLPGRLIPVTKPDDISDSFAISDIVFQARYRWEIAPLSDLFIVYVKASDIARPLGQDNYSDLLDRAWAEPIADQLVMKLRYRFGS